MNWINLPAPTRRGPLATLFAALLVSVLLAGAASAASVAGAQKIPRLANGKPDFSGIWQGTTAADYGLEPHGARVDAPPGAGIVEGDQIPYLPAALAQRDKNFAQRDRADPRLKGWTLGVPRGVYYPEPFQIFQRAQDLTLFHQFGHSVRTIYTNGTGHRAGESNEFWLGDSRGRCAAPSAPASTRRAWPRSASRAPAPPATGPIPAPAR